MIMMNKIMFIFSIGLLMAFSAPVVIYPVYIKEYNVYLYPDNGCSKRYTLKANDSTTLKVNLSSCKGSMMVEVYFKDMLIEKGKYINSLDLLRKYDNRVSYNRKKNKHISEIIVSEYYQPLRDSVWLFYNHDSVSRKVYNRGIEVKYK